MPASREPSTFSQTALSAGSLADHSASSSDSRGTQLRKASSSEPVSNRRSRRIAAKQHSKAASPRKQLKSKSRGPASQLLHEHSSVSSAESIAVPDQDPPPVRSEASGATRTPKKDRARPCPYPTPEKTPQKRRRPLPAPLSSDSPHMLFLPSTNLSPEQSERTHLVLEALAQAASVAMQSPYFIHVPRAPLRTPASSLLGGDLLAAPPSRPGTMGPPGGRSRPHATSMACTDPQYARASHSSPPGQPVTQPRSYRAIDVWLLNRRLPLPTRRAHVHPGARHAVDNACIRLLDDRF